MTRQTLWVPSGLPSFNKIIEAAKGHWSKYRKKKQNWTDFVYFCILEAKIQPIPPGRRLIIEFTWVYPKQGKLEDPDNVAAAKKFILDALVQASIIPDDSFKYVAGFTDQFRRVGEPAPWYVPRTLAIEAPSLAEKKYLIRDCGVWVTLYATN